MARNNIILFTYLSQHRLRTEGLPFNLRPNKWRWFTVVPVKRAESAECVGEIINGCKGLPPMRETQVRSLGREDPLEKEMATHSSILAWRIPWTEEPGGLQSMGLDTTKVI